MGAHPLPLLGHEPMLGHNDKACSRETVVLGQTWANEVLSCSTTGGGGHGYRRTGLRTESERGSRTAHSLYTKLRLLPRNLEFAMHPLSTRARHAIVDAGAIAQIHCDSSGILYTPYLHTHTRVLQ